MAFSGALTLTDLNDYLGPSQACIKPLEGPDPPNSSDTAHDGNAQPIDPAAAASTQIAIDHDGSYYESSAASSTTNNSKPRQRTKLETAEISLNDCLACSGCVTSAESVLITMQSHHELRRAVQELRDDTTTTTLLVASVSPQSLASLSAKYTFQAEPTKTTSNLPLHVLLHRISYFLKSAFGFDHVYDTTFARHIALKEHQREFFERRANTKPNPSTSEAPTLPMLASACPGWICYAEKTHGQLLPYVSTTKSPQQVAGVMAKRFLPARLGLAQDTTDAARPTSVYHVTVMPCYDKKLEASRPDFYDDITHTKDVDCVLTTGELDRLMLDDAFDICQPVPGEDEALRHLRAQAPPHPEATPETALPRIPHLLDQPGSSSGGYLFALMRAVWHDWLASNADRLPESAVLPKLDVRIIRTADYTEFVLRAPPPATGGTTPILFRGAQCYGFRNLQNLVRKIQKQTGARNARGAAGRLVDADGNALGAATRNRAAAARARARGRAAIVRRAAGRAAESAAVGTSSPLNPDADVASTQLTPAQEEEGHGYDYVEVMACPSGCVNGGGQIRPPTGSDVGVASSTAPDGAAPDGAAPDGADPEGFAHGGWVGGHSVDADVDLEAMLGNKTCVKKSEQLGSDDAEIDDAERDSEIKGWQGTSKEWVRRVEAAYWQGSRVAHLPVDVAPNGLARSESGVSGASTPTLVGSGANTPLSSSHAKSIRIQDHQRLLEALVASTRSEPDAGDRMAYADLLAELVVTELSHLSIRADAMPDSTALAKARHALLRTHYRAVQDEAVNGLAVQW